MQKSVLYSMYCIVTIYCVSLLYAHNNIEVCSDSDQTGSQYIDTCHLVCVSADV